MIRTLKLLLPALIPAWNFFDVIAASPRIEYALLPAPSATDTAWVEFRPRPERLSPPVMIGRLFWNARWNETLFVVSCAERLLAAPNAHSEDEIFRRIAADIADQSATGEAWLKFRITLVSEHKGAPVREIAFVSEVRRVAALTA